MRFFKFIEFFSQRLKSHGHIVESVQPTKECKSSKIEWYTTSRRSVSHTDWNLEFMNAERNRIFWLLEVWRFVLTGSDEIHCIALENKKPCWYGSWPKRRSHRKVGKARIKVVSKLDLNRSRLLKRKPYCLEQRQSNHNNWPFGTLAGSAGFEYDVATEKREKLKKPKER